MTTTAPIPIRRLNHAVLYVRDAEQSARFYGEVLGFQVVDRLGNGAAVFLRAGDSDNHHDLGLFTVGPAAAGPTPGGVGLYHLAWEVAELTDLVAARATLQRAGAFRGESDHGVSKSLYGADLDGNEFEVMWSVPRDEWGEYETAAVTKPLDLDREVSSRSSQ